MRVLAIAAVALPVLGIFYILLRLARQLLTGLWQKTRGKALQRGTALAVIARRAGRARLGLVARRGKLPPGPAL